MHFRRSYAPFWLKNQNKWNWTAKVHWLPRLSGFSKSISISIQRDNAASVLETLSTRIDQSSTLYADYDDDKTSTISFRFFLKFNLVMLCKETLRPLTLVMAYFMFFVMSGLSPIRPNMVNVCGALGMAGDPKNIVVSG